MYGSASAKIVGGGIGYSASGSDGGADEGYMVGAGTVAVKVAYAA